MPSRKKKPKQKAKPLRIKEEKPAPKPKPKKARLLLPVIAVILIVLVVAVAWVALQQPPNPEPKPEGISLTIINAPSNCINCKGLDDLVKLIKAQAFAFDSEKTLEPDSEEALQLIQAHNIEMLPSLVITGDLSNNLVAFWQQQALGSIEEKALVLRKKAPPYFDLKSNSVKGVVNSVVLVERDCADCFDIDKTVEEIRSSGVFILTKDKAYTDEKKGQDLIEKYGLKKAPVWVLSSDANEYEGITEAWKREEVGFIASDGSFVYTGAVPYFDLQDKNLHGLVNVTYIVDGQCVDCYDAYSVHRALLERLGVRIYVENIVDISTDWGKGLVKDYNITEIPTIILSSSASEYSLLTNAWKKVGTIESDGSYVFRDLNSLGVKFETINPGELS